MMEWINITWSTRTGSNFTQKQIQDILDGDSGICPAVNQVELHPYLAQPSLTAFCKEKGIVMMGYSPLGKITDTLSYVHVNCSKLALIDWNLGQDLTLSLPSYPFPISLPFALSRRTHSSNLLLDTYAPTRMRTRRVWRFVLGQVLPWCRDRQVRNTNRGLHFAPELSCGGDSDQTAEVGR